MPTIPFKAERLDRIAVELGVPPVRTGRDAFPLLVVAGLLVREGADVYRGGRPARIDTVLSLPPEGARSDLRSRFQGIAEDAVSVLRWTPGPTFTTTAAELAGRLLIEERDLGDALAYAEEAGLVTIEGEGPLQLGLGPEVTS